MSEEQKTPRELWVEALRSGEYEQGKMRLCRNGKRCCLGVACDLYQKNVGDLEQNTYDEMPDVEVIAYDGNASTLPLKVKNWLGIADDHGSYGREGDFLSLTRTNDDGRNFYEIADIIESNPPGLFIENSEESQ